VDVRGYVEADRGVGTGMVGGTSKVVRWCSVRDVWSRRVEEKVAREKRFACDGLKGNEVSMKQLHGMVRYKLHGQHRQRSRQYAGTGDVFPEPFTNTDKSFAGHSHKSIYL
jgi:hypothetical protein